MNGWILLTDILYVQETILRYHKIFFYCRLLAVVCGGLSVMLFIALGIPGVLGEITGVSAKKMIKKFEENNAAAMRHTQKKFFETGKGLSWEIKRDSSQNETVVLQEETTILQQDTGGATSVLDTATVDRNATRVLDTATEDTNATRVLDE
ncbi:MAG: hypothetical protein K2N73_08290 [Lachnospiraceae bacterium]|nr:hypothetical protein [Lachnospiraceae bacterium]